MKAEAQKLSQAMPGDTAIMSNIQSTEDHNIGRTTSDGLMAFLSTWNVPADVKTKFQMGIVSSFFGILFVSFSSFSLWGEVVGLISNHACSLPLLSH
jgi:hypothetical protein